MRGASRAGLVGHSYTLFYREDLSQDDAASRIHLFEEAKSTSKRIVNLQGLCVRSVCQTDNLKSIEC